MSSTFYTNLFFIVWILRHVMYSFKLSVQLFVGITEWRCFTSYINIFQRLASLCQDKLIQQLLFPFCLVSFLSSVFFSEIWIKTILWPSARENNYICQALVWFFVIQVAKHDWVTVFTNLDSKGSSFLFNVVAFLLYLLWISSIQM